MKSDGLTDSRKQAPPYTHLVVIVAVSGLIGGAIAIGMVFLMSWLCNQSWVVDEAGSHGISEVRSSRLGGVAIFFGALIYAFAESFVSTARVSQGVFSSSDELFPGYLGFVLLIALVGLWDDFVARFSPIARLTLVLTISAAALVSDVVPMKLSAYEWLPFGLNTPMILTIAGTLVVTGFVNAGNMADGANGLLGTVGISFLSVLLFYDGGSFAHFFIMALLIFVIFNVSTGRIFLGDFGAYGLSAMIAFGSLELYAGGKVSLWFLGSLLAYPCIEMVRVVVVRALQGNSPLQASNDHLHNYLYDFLRNWGLNRIVANSSTGLFMGAMSASLPAFLVFFGVIDARSTNLWGLYFGIYAVLHLALAIRLKGALRGLRADQSYSVR